MRIKHTIRESGLFRRTVLSYKMQAAIRTGKRSDTVFQDVEENRYEAPLLSDVPKCTYDFSDLKTDEQTGYKSYQGRKQVKGKTWDRRI